MVTFFQCFYYSKLKKAIVTFKNINKKWVLRKKKHIRYNKVLKLGKENSKGQQEVSSSRHLQVTSNPLMSEIFKTI